MTGYIWICRDVLQSRLQAWQQWYAATHWIWEKIFYETWAGLENLGRFQTRVRMRVTLVTENYVKLLHSLYK